MYVFNRFGVYITRFSYSFILFFSFLGHLCYGAKDFLSGRLSVSWSNVIKIVYYSGAALIIPLIIVNGLIAMSLGLNAHIIFSQVHLQHKALAVSETLLVQDLLPLLLAFVLCVQVALNLITHRVKITKHGQSIEEVMLDYILPIMLGIYLAIFCLYVYIFLSTFASLFLTYHYLVGITSKEYFYQVIRNINMLEIIYSLTKTLIYGTIVSLTAGYYYYQSAVNQMGARKAVSRILTRGAFWLAVASVYGKIITI
jgi:ABC-type transporter Mla maintaining outer membrane lipid asymmetry permease subunit MlaE